MTGKSAAYSLDRIPLVSVVDAKDTHDKVGSETTTGSQKSLAYTIAWLRQVFRRPQASIRWTATENMFVDAGTKDMDTSQFRSVLTGGYWSIEYDPSFVKAKFRKAVKGVAPTLTVAELPGQKVTSDNAMYKLLQV